MTNIGWCCFLSVAKKRRHTQARKKKNEWCLNFPGGGRGVVVDLMIIILFLVRRVAQKQLLDAILIIAEQKDFKLLLFFTLVSSLKKTCVVKWCVLCLHKNGKKERKREKNETTFREKVKEGKIRFQKQKVLALFSRAKNFSHASKSAWFSLFQIIIFVQRNLSRKTPSNY